MTNPYNKDMIDNLNEKPKHTIEILNRKFRLKS